LSKMLSSWKEIAHFFGKGVRTVQRWEKTLDLPIHRPPGAPSNVVLARTSDLEEWMHRGAAARAVSNVSSGDSLSSVVAMLEREVTSTARHAGVHGEPMDENASVEERIAAVTEIVSQVNEKLAARAIRAA
jgi:hypothetical protein